MRYYPATRRELNQLAENHTSKQAPVAPVMRLITVYIPAANPERGWLWRDIPVTLAPSDEEGETTSTFEVREAFEFAPGMTYADLANCGRDTCYD